MATRRAARRSRRLPLVGGGRPPRRLLVVLAVVLVTAGTTWFSGASFSSTSETTATVRAAADYYPPSVAVTSPGAVVSGTTTVTATASDSASAITSVRIEHSASDSGSWTTLCTDTTAPYSCAWDTTTVADGPYGLRATATDASGASATSSTATTTVANAASVVLATVPDNIRGTHVLSATVTGAGTRTVSSRFQYRLAGTTTWTSMSGCTTVAGTSPTCSWATGTLTDVYDVQVVSTLGTGTTTVVSDVQTDITVDNLAPTVTVSAPSPMSGTVLVTTTPVDDDSGIASVLVQVKSSTVATWTDLCTTTAEPYRCTLDTTKLGYTSADLRAIATDAAGNVTTSAVITRQVVNGAASITITSPSAGDVVRGTTTLTADTATPANMSVTEVRYERRLPGGTWGTACTASTAPWSCAWDTTSVTSAGHELRAVMTYTGGTHTSATILVTVDNNPLRALDVQATNGGTAGRAGAGDTLTLTYSGAVDLTTIKAGWTGGSTAVTVTMTDKARTGTTTDRATFDANLGHVTFAQNYVRKNRAVTVPATMTATTSTVGGATTTTVVVTLGTTTTNDLTTSTASGTMYWTPSSAVRSTTGTAVSPATATESGALDADL